MKEEIKSYKLLDTEFPPNPAIKNAKLYVLNQTTNKVETYITDKFGNPKALKDDTGSGGGGTYTFYSSDNTITISGTSSVNLILEASLLSSINNAIQAGDNISELTNDLGYINSTTGNWTGTFDGQEGAYYLDYNNLNNKPTIPSDITDLSDVYSSMIPSNGQVLTFNTVNGWQAESPVSGVTDHTLLSNIGTNTHLQIDSHIADATLHFTMGSISITESQISDLQTYLTSSDIDTFAELQSIVADETIAKYGDNLSEFTNDVGFLSSISGLSHTILTDIGTNTHVQIDTHIADNTIHFTQSSISITESQISDLGNYAESLIELSDVNTATPTDKNVLIADGVDWESRALVISDISDLDLSNYLTGSLTNNQVVIASGTTTVDGNANFTYDGTTLALSGLNANISLNTTTGVLYFEGTTNFEINSNEGIKLREFGTANYHNITTQATSIGLTAEIQNSSGTFAWLTDIPTVSDDAYGIGWDGNTDVATKNAIYDKIETIVGGGDMLAATYDPANKEEQVLTVSDILDEDDMSSDSDTKVPTQQSVKAYVDANSSSPAPVEKTGNTIVFTERANYNQTTPASSGNITIDSTGAVKDTVIAFFFNGSTEPTISGATNLIKSGRFKADTDLIYWFIWMDGKYVLNIQSNTIIQLLTPTNFVAASASTTSILLTWDVVTNADNYILLSSTTNDIGTASSIYEGALLTYTHTGRTTSETNYYWLQATDTSDLYSDSANATASGSAEASIIVESDDFTGSTIDTAIWDETTATNGVITQDNQLELSSASTEASFFGLILKDAVGTSNDIIIAQCKFTMPNTANHVARFGITKATYDANEIAALTRSTSNPNYNQFRGLIIDGGSYEVSVNTSVNSGVDCRIKYVPSTGAITFEYWNGSAWTELSGTSGNVDLGSTVKAFLYTKVDASTASIVEFDDFYISNNNYSTRYPS